MCLCMKGGEAHVESKMKELILCGPSDCDIYCHFHGMKQQMEQFR